MTDRLAYFTAQSAVIGSMLIDDTCCGEIFHRLRPEQFSAEYRTIFEACRQLFLAGEPVDPIKVVSRIGSDYREALLGIMDATPTAANAGIYTGLVEEQAELNRLRDLGEELQDAPDLDRARTLIADCSRFLAERPGVRVVSFSDGLTGFYARQGEAPVTLRWGFDRLDAAAMAEPGDFVIIGGYPSAGKTAFSLQLAIQQAEEHRVGYFSLETKPEKLIDRAVSSLSGVALDRIKRRKLGVNDWEALAGTSAHAEIQLDIIQAGGMTVSEIRALSLARRYEIVYIDYLQLITPDDRRRTRYDQVTQISVDLHTLAQTTGITVVALAQLSRPETDRDGVEKAPTMHSLRESGQIEQDADLILLLYQSGTDAGRRTVKIAKNKDGRSGGILELAFTGDVQRFSEAGEKKPLPKAPQKKAGPIAQQLVSAGAAAKRKNRAAAQARQHELTGWADDAPKEDSKT